MRAQEIFQAENPKIQQSKKSVFTPRYLWNWRIFGCLLYFIYIPSIEGWILSIARLSDFTGFYSLIAISLKDTPCGRITIFVCRWSADVRARNAQWRIDQRHDRAVRDGGEVLVEVEGVSGRSSVPDQMRPGKIWKLFWSLHSQYKKDKNKTFCLNIYGQEGFLGIVPVSPFCCLSFFFFISLSHRGRREETQKKFTSQVFLFVCLISCRSCLRPVPGWCHEHQAITCWESSPLATGCLQTRNPSLYLLCWQAAFSDTKGIPACVVSVGFWQQGIGDKTGPQPCVFGSSLHVLGAYTPGVCRMSTWRLSLSHISLFLFPFSIISCLVLSSFISPF